MTFLTIFAMILSITIYCVNGKVHQLNEYLILKNPSWDGDSLDLKVNRDLLLFRFYNDDGIATKVIHADSIRVNGVCNEIDIHVVRNEFTECTSKFPESPRNRVMCIWNKRNTIQSAKIKTRRAYGGESVNVELYDKKNCQKRIKHGSLIVEKTSNVSLSPISDCIRVESVRNSGGRKVLFKMNIRKVLQQHYEGGDQRCGRFTFVESVRVNGVCGSFNAHVFTTKDFKKCKNLKGTEFKKCFWTPKLMTNSMFLDSVSAFKGAKVDVKTFRNHSCEWEWDSGFLIVQ